MSAERPMVCKTRHSSGSRFFFSPFFARRSRCSCAETMSAVWKISKQYPPVALYLRDSWRQTNEKTTESGRFPSSPPAALGQAGIEDSAPGTVAPKLRPSGTSTVGPDTMLILASRSGARPRFGVRGTPLRLRHRAPIGRCLKISTWPVRDVESCRIPA